MTQKELSYFEDAAGHESNIIKIVEDMINKLDDQKLVAFMEGELEKHQSLKQKLMNVLESRING